MASHPIDGPARCRRRRFVYAIIIALAAGTGAAGILTVRPLLSANDRSRWSTVWALVERGTYAIDDVAERPGWRTIDKVRFRGHFYSTKPALLPTLVAGVYWTVKQATGWNLIDHTSAVTRSVLLFVNLLPMLAALAVLAAILERYARRESSRIFVLLTAAVGTLLTPFLVTLNNHVVAAVSVVFALYPALRIVADGADRPRYFVLAGFFAAFTCTHELPAALFGLAMFGVLLWRAPAATWKFFVPAALVPLAAFFATTYAVAGDWRPFYLFYGEEPYNYVYRGVPSYWVHPSGIDANTEPWYLYLLHCTFGHHGVFSLSPVFLLSLAGWACVRKRRGGPLEVFLWMGLALTAAMLLFYLSRTENYNYGGRTAGLRWLLWLIPFWLLAMIPALDRWGRRRWVAAGSTAMLAVSVFSAMAPLENPWQHPWLYTSMERWGWIDYRQRIPDFQRPMTTWFRTLPEPGTGGEAEWIELAAPEPDGDFARLRLTDGGRRRVHGRLLQTVVVNRSTSGGGARAAYHIDVEAFRAGKPPAEFLRWPEGVPPAADQRRAAAFLHGLPRLRKGGFRRGKVGYLFTDLRDDAYRCRRAAGEIDHRPQPGAPVRRYRCEVWLCRELPFGMAQVEWTVSEKRSGRVLSRRRWKVVAASREGPVSPDAGQSAEPE